MGCRAVGFIVTLALSILMASLTAEAQRPSHVPRIRVLSGGAFTPDSREREAFLQGLRALGYVEGQTSSWRSAWPRGSWSGSPTSRPNWSGSRWISSSRGWAGSQSRRPGNGAHPYRPRRWGCGGGGAHRQHRAARREHHGAHHERRRVEREVAGAGKEAVPAVSRVAVLSHPESSIAGVVLKEMQVAAPALGVQLQSLSVRDADELEGAFAAMSREHAEGLVVLPGAIFNTHRARIIELAARSRLPTMWERRDAVAEGGLMAYGTDSASLWRRAATYVDKILKGAQPGTLPVERPMTFKLVINLKTAQALGLTIPPVLLFQATEVIQ